MILDPNTGEQERACSVTYNFSATQGAYNTLNYAKAIEYRDVDSKRRGNVFSAQVIVPLSVAVPFLNSLQYDPLAAREFSQRVFEGVVAGGQASALQNLLPSYDGIDVLSVIGPDDHPDSKLIVENLDIPQS
jgi:hypothetical protein